MTDAFSKLNIERRRQCKKSQQQQLHNEENTTSRRTGRKRTITDYSKLLNYDDESETERTLPKSPVKHKHPTNLLQKPSRNRQKIECIQRKNNNKKSKPANKQCQLSTSSNTGTPPTNMFDSIFPDAQPKSSTTPELGSQPAEHEEVAAKTTGDTNILPDTILATPSTSSAQPMETLMVPAISEEMRTAIDALLSLGADLQLGLEAEQTDNEILQPIAPGSILPDTTPPVSAINTDNNQKTDDQGDLDEEENHNETNTNGADKKPESKKGKLIV